MHFKTTTAKNKTMHNKRNDQQNEKTTPGMEKISANTIYLIWN